MKEKDREKLPFELEQMVANIRKIGISRFQPSVDDSFEPYLKAIAELKLPPRPQNISPVVNPRVLKYIDRVIKAQMEKEIDK